MSRNVRRVAARVYRPVCNGYYWAQCFYTEHVVPSTEIIEEPVSVLPPSAVKSDQMLPDIANSKPVALNSEFCTHSDYSDDDEEEDNDDSSSGNTKLPKKMPHTVLASCKISDVFWHPK